MKMKNIMIAMFVIVLLVLQAGVVCSTGNSDIIDLPPMVTLIASAQEGDAPLTVSFIAVGYDKEDKQDLTYSWEFGDGLMTGYYPSKTATHTYTKDGTFYATVRAKDEKGNIARGTVVIKVLGSLIDHPPIATIMASAKEGELPFTVSFIATAYDKEDKSNLQYSWDFGDGHTTSWTYSMTTTHTYKKSGEFTVSPRVKDSKGNIGRDSTKINVLAKRIDDLPPQVSINAMPTTAEKGGIISFIATVNDEDRESVSLSWNFGDGTTYSSTSSLTTTHRYSSTGDYTVSVTATDKSGNKGRGSITIKITEPKPTDGLLVPPVVIATASPTTGRSPLAVNFFGQAITVGGSKVISYLWDFGDGTLSNNKNTIHVYVIPGTYTATLRVEDSNGLSAQDSVAIKVRPPMTGSAPLIADIPNHKAVIAQPYKLQVVAIDPDGDPLTYSASGLPLGLRISSKTGLISGAPTQLGTFKVEVSASDGKGSSTEDFLLFVVKDTKEEPTPGPFPVPPEEITFKLRSKHMHIDRVSLINGEYLPLGEILGTAVKVSNEAVVDFKNINIRASIPELGLTKSALIRDLSENEDELKKLFMELPMNAPLGDYTLRVSISNDKIQRVVHRIFTITK